MEQSTLFNFITMSIPEEFLMVFFTLIILGKKDDIKLSIVFLTSIVTAAVFLGTQCLLYPDVVIVAVINLIAFALIMYFIFKLNLVEAIVGVLLTQVVSLIIQSTVLNICFLITDFNIDDLSENSIIKLAFSWPAFVIFGVVAIVLYKYNIKVLNFKKNNTSVHDINKVRYVVLQLSFTFLILIFNFKLYFFNKNLFVSSYDKLLISINLCLVVLFTVLVVRSAFIMGKSIQEEEERKRKFDGREIIQNIDYLCKLMDLKKYDEVSNILISMKSEINSGMVGNVDSNNRGDSIK